MHEKQWEWTILDRVHEVLASEISLQHDEYSIVSYYAGADDWTLMTTHRMVGSVDAQRTEVGRDDFRTTDFGNFKQDLDSPRITRARIAVRGESHTFLYESGYASMAPIYYFRFWSVKWTAWRETYRLSRRQSIAEPAAGGNAE